MAFARAQKHFRTRIFGKLRSCCCDGSVDETAPKENPSQTDIEQVFFVINPDYDITSISIGNVNRVIQKGDIHVFNWGTSVHWRRRCWSLNRGYQLFV